MKRQPYQPKRFGLVKAQLAFAPVASLLNEIATQGTVSAERGVAFMPDWNGELVQVVPALLAWCDNWQRIARAANVRIDTFYQRRICACLDCGRPIMPDEIQKALEELSVQYSAYRTLPASLIDAEVRTERIAIALEEAGVTGSC